METIVNRLKKYIDSKGVSVSVAEKEIGISNGSLAKPFKANTTIKTDALEKFLKRYTDINPLWLLTGEGEMLKTETVDHLMNDQWKELAESRKDIIDLQKKEIIRLEKVNNELRIVAAGLNQSPGNVTTGMAEPKKELTHK